MLASLRRKQTPSAVESKNNSVPKRSASSAEPRSVSLSESERRRLSSPITGIKTTKEFSAPDDDEADFGDSEENDTPSRPKTANGKGSNRLSMSINGNLNKVIEDDSKRPGSSGRREGTRHPHRISEEEEPELSRATTRDSSASQKTSDNPVHAWMAAAARVAAQGADGELRRLRSDSNENRQDRQSALDSLMGGNSDARPTSKDSAKAVNRWENAPITSTSNNTTSNTSAQLKNLQPIYTTPAAGNRETSVYGNVYGSEIRPGTAGATSDDEHPPSPKPRSPSSPSKTQFPRGHDGFDPSTAPPVPPLPSIASQASSSQETLSHYLTPKSSFYNEKEPVRINFDDISDTIY